LGLSLGVNYFTILAYAVLAMTGGTWLQVVFGALSFTIIEKAREAKKHRIEYLAAREVPLALGRVLGLGCFLAGQAHFGETGLRIAVLVLGFSHLGLLLLLPKKKVMEIHAPGLEKL
jgi:YQGE family putative transporter